MPLGKIKNKINHGIEVAEQNKRKTKAKLSNSDSRLANAIVEEMDSGEAELKDLGNLIEAFQQEIEDEHSRLEMSEDLMNRLTNNVVPDLVQLEEHEAKVIDLLDDYQSDSAINEVPDKTRREISQEFQEVEETVKQLHQDVQQVREEFQEETKHLREEDQEFEQCKELLESLVKHENRTETLVHKIDDAVKRTS